MINRTPNSFTALRRMWVKIGETTPWTIIHLVEMINWTLISFIAATKDMLWDKSPDLGNSLLHGVTSDEAVDHDLVCLTNSVGATEGLDVVVGVPVRVINNDSVRCCQIDAQTPSTSRQQEGKLRRIGCCSEEQRTHWEVLYKNVCYTTNPQH